MFFGPGLLVSFVVGAAGFVAFMYGRSQGRVPHMAAGVALMVAPWFVDGMLMTLAAAVGLLGLLWGATRLGW